MKTGAVFQILLTCIVLMFACVLTINSSYIHSAEMELVLNRSAKAISTKYINGDYDSVEAFESALESDIANKLTGSYETINVSVPYANSDFGVVDIRVTYSYKRIAGGNKYGEFHKTFIKECDDGTGEPLVPYIRSINSSYYKLDANTFVASSSGGLASNSIWKTDSYSVILDSLFNIPQTSGGGSGEKDCSGGHTIDYVHNNEAGHCAFCSVCLNYITDGGEISNTPDYVPHTYAPLGGDSHQCSVCNYTGQCVYVFDADVGTFYHVRNCAGVTTDTLPVEATYTKTCPTCGRTETNNGGTLLSNYGKLLSSPSGYFELYCTWVEQPEGYQKCSCCGAIQCEHEYTYVLDGHSVSHIYNCDGTEWVVDEDYYDDGTADVPFERTCIKCGDTFSVNLYSDDVGTYTVSGDSLTFDHAWEEYEDENGNWCESCSNCGATK